MKKYFILIVLHTVFFSYLLCAQSSETSANATSRLDRTQLRKVENPAQDKTDKFEIQSLGGTTFTTANTYDGTLNSYKHSLLITMDIVPAAKTAGTDFQLVFYSDPSVIPQAATYASGALYIYYPVNLYEGIKDKLEQALAARKKVYVQVIQKTTGYREGSLIF